MKFSGYILRSYRLLVPLSTLPPNYLQCLPLTKKNPVSWMAHPISHKEMDCKAEKEEFSILLQETWESGRATRSIEGSLLDTKPLFLEWGIWSP